MSKRTTLIAALLLVPAIGFAAEGNAPVTGRRAVAWFKKADADGDGTLSRAEIETARPRLFGKFDSIDADKDGRLSRSELRAWAAAQKVERQKTGSDPFRHADTDGDGAISRAEAKKHAPRLAKKFDRIDTDKDGRLTQDEMRAYREAKRGRKNHAQCGTGCEVPRRAA